MSYTERDTLLALAGLCQAVWLTQRLATTGSVDSEAMAVCIGSLFKLDSQSVEDVYGGAIPVVPGLAQLRRLLADARRDIDQTRYLVALLQLEAKLGKRADLLEQIRTGILTVRSRLEYFDLLHPNILAQLADIYSSYVSPLGPRILVRGEAVHLQHAENQNQVRALLLAGIRSARLWRQVGGRRWQVILNRRRLLAATSELIDSLAPH